MEKKQAEFQIQEMLPIVLTFIVMGIGISFGLTVINDVNADQITNTAGCNATHTSSCGLAFNATQDTMEATTNLTSKLPTIMTVIVAAILIGLLTRYLMVQ